MKVTEAKLRELVPDDKNFNRGTDGGKKLIRKSLEQFGAGRSGLLDKNNRIIAGNKFAENATELGYDDCIIVESDGTKPIFVKRTDIDLDTKKGREMALADNKTSEVNLEWDEEAIAEAVEQWDIAPEDWGMEETEETNAGSGSKDLSERVTEMYQIAIDCDSEVEQERIYNELKDKYSCRVLTL